MFMNDIIGIGIGDSIYQEQSIGDAWQISGIKHCSYIRANSKAMIISIYGNIGKVSINRDITIGCWYDIGGEGKES